MAFSNYKNIAQVQQKFKIKHIEESFIVSIQTTPSPEFIQDLDFVQQHIDIYSSEAARCEAIIFPVLKDIYKQYHQKLALWIKKHIAYDNDLHGEPDYLLSTKSELGKKVLEKPLLAVVEAKKNDFEYGWGQCLAELVALQMINDMPGLTLYGIVSDGNLWQFGKLQKNIFVQDTTSFTLDNLDVLFGALVFVFEQMESELHGVQNEDRNDL